MLVGAGLAIAAMVVAGCAGSASHGHGQPRSTGTPARAMTSDPQASQYRLGGIDFLGRTHGYGQFSAGSGSACRTAVAATSDGGARFGAPVTVDSWPCGGTAPAALLAFDDHGDGFLYGPKLFVTHDAGQHWRPSRQPGQVLAVAPAGRSVWMLAASCPRGPGERRCPLRLLISADGGRTWRPAPSQPPGAARGEGGRVLTEPADGQTWLMRTGQSAGYVLGSVVPNDRGRADSAPMWFTGDAGASWAARRVPCGLDGLSVAVSAAPDGTLLGVCASEPGAGFQRKSVARSADGGRHWVLSNPRGALDFGYLGAVMARSATTAFLVGGRSPLLVTRDGGRDWSVVRAVTAGSDGGTVSVQFPSPRVGFILGDDFSDDELPTIWLTLDSGVHWSALHPKID